MSVDIQAWHNSYANFELQVQEFNDKTKKSSLSKEEVDSIYSVVKQEVKRLSELSVAISAREEELSRKDCLSPNTKALTRLAIISTACKICEIVGAVIAIFEDTPAAKFTGLGVLIVGAGLDEITNLYEASLYLWNEEVGKLAKINKEGVEHAKTFKKFIKQLREVQHLETQQLEEKESKDAMPVHIAINSDSLDKSISECLKKYDKLPVPYRREDVYCRIISHLIQKLPPADPLRQGLEELEPTANQDVSILAQRSIPVKYLPDNKIESDDKTEDEKWHAEEQIHLEEKKIADSQEIDSTPNLLAYKQRIAYYQHLVMQRFKLEHNIAFLETPQGWQISPSETAKRINDSEEELLSPLISNNQDDVDYIV